MSIGKKQLLFEGAPERGLGIRQATVHASLALAAATVRSHYPEEDAHAVHMETGLVPRTEMPAMQQPTLPHPSLKHMVTGPEA